MSKYQLTTIRIGDFDVDAKRCRGCDIIKPLTDYYKSKHCLGGVAPRCKVCNGYKGKYKQAKIIYIGKEGLLLEGKECKRCLRVLPMEDFAEIKGSKKAVGNRYATCRECERLYRQELDKDPERRERRLRRSRRYTQKYKYRRREIYKKYREDNLERFKVKDANRWSRKKLLVNSLTEVEYQHILELFDNKCALTGEESDDITLEHFIPLSWGHGGSYVGNVYPVIGHLNYSKQDTHPFLWIQREDIKEKITIDKWQALINYLAETNGMTVSEFECFVDWCYENKRTIDDLKKDNTNSLELYRNSRI